MDNYRNIIDRELESMTFNELRQRRSIKMKNKIKAAKPAVAAAAVCAVMACGVTAAAFSGVFGAMFGRIVRVDNDELADSLMGTLSGVQSYVSDDDYRIDINGIAGDGYDIYLIAEISRTDGTPVTEHFLNPSDEEYLAMLRDSYFNEEEAESPSEILSMTRMIYINEKGNIEMSVERKSNEPMDGRSVYLAGKNFYPSGKYYKTLRENGVFNSSEGYRLLDENGEWTDIPADFDDSGIKLLDLEWSLSFSFEPSQQALKKLTCSSPEEGFTYYQDVFEWKTETTPSGRPIKSLALDTPSAVISDEARVKEIEIGTLSGRVVFEYDMSETEQTYYYELTELSGPDSGSRLVRPQFSLEPSRTNELYLIKNDGSQIPAKFELGAVNNRNGAVLRDMNIIYTGDARERILAETSEITAISINGTVYELN